MNQRLDAPTQASPSRLRNGRTVKQRGRTYKLTKNTKKTLNKGKTSGSTHPALSRCSGVMNISKANVPLGAIFPTAILSFAADLAF